MSKQERNKKNLRMFYEQVFNTGNVELLERFVTVDRPDHEPGLPPDMTNGRDGLRQAIMWLRSAFPDLSITPDFMIAEGNLVTCYTHVAGTHRGNLMDKAPTGASFKMPNTDICRFTEDGLIAEHWGTFNMMEMLKQLGLLA